MSGGQIFNFSTDSSRSRNKTVELPCECVMCLLNLLSQTSCSELHCITHHRTVCIETWKCR